MTAFKSIFCLILLVSALATIYAKPFPIWIDLDRVSEDTLQDKFVKMESDKEVANSQMMPLRKVSHEEESELAHISDDYPCPWPPALCGDGGFWGEFLDFSYLY